jgi:hypothetical protein
MIRESTLRQIKRAFGLELKVEGALAGDYVWIKISSASLIGALESWEPNSPGWPQLIGLVAPSKTNETPDQALLLWELPECGTVLGVHSDPNDFTDSVFLRILLSQWPHVELPLRKAGIMEGPPIHGGDGDTGVAWR